MLTDLHHFIRDFNWTAENTATLIVGLLLGMAASAMVFWWIRKHFGTRIDPSLKRELQEEQGKAKLLKEMVGDRDLQIQRLNMELQTKQDEFQAVEAKCDTVLSASAEVEQQREKYRDLNRTHRDNVIKANHTIRALKSRIMALKGQLQTSADHIQAIVEREGKFWETTPNGATPAFRPLKPDRAPIIALVNLKGGVGKTTLTANLGATLWTHGQRTLLVDLDNQGSLTQLCLFAEDVQDLHRGGGRFVHHLFKSSTPNADLAWDNLTRLGETEGMLLAADEKLADVEEHAKATWLLQPHSRDVRYTLRQALHAPAIQERFDAILLDCPPRLSTACINALACCDFVLMPVLLDKTSMDAVPRLLTWLRLLKERGVCAEMRVLGVLANRTRYREKLTGRERDRWSSLADKCSTAWGEPVHLFERWIPDKVLFAEAAETRKLAALADELAPIFKDLLTELKERNAIHDRRRPAAVRT